MSDFLKMRMLLLSWLLVGCAIAQPATPNGNIAAVGEAAQGTVKVVMHTALGDITLDIETERAPITARNFLRYVDQKRYDGMTFYRAVKIVESGEYGMVQAGLRGDPKKVFKPIALEPTTKTGLSHVDGAISMARLEPDSATADFFVVIGTLTGLDAHPEAQPAQGDNLGYAVFGHVSEGMDVIKNILMQPTSLTAGVGAMQGQMLAAPVKVLTVRRVVP